MYSYHAKDPAYLKLLNAFDLVRVHLFGDAEDGKSFDEMVKFALKQDKVKLMLASDKEEQAQAEFNVLDDSFAASSNDNNRRRDDGKDCDDDPGDGGIEGTEGTGAVQSDWKTRLQFAAKSGELKNNVWNLTLILTNDARFRNIGFNEMANKVQVIGEVPWSRPEGNPYWRDADTAQMKALIDILYTAFSERNYDVAFKAVIDNRRFHPIRDYLDNLPDWDGKPRLDTLFIDYFGAEDTSYIRAVTRKPFVAAVTRIYHPGVKFDTIPIIAGPQGIGKSTIFKKLSAPWFSDSLTLTDMKDKAGAEKLQGFWILELGELAGMKKADIESVKSFISRTDDDYRPSYGRTVESHPRQCIIVGSTNSESGFLRDITGNRRFWPVKALQGVSTSKKKSWNLTKSEVDQIWAEAKTMYKKGETLYLDPEDEKAAEMAQKDAMEHDERQGMIEEYLNTLLPSNWDKLDIFERRRFLGENDPIVPVSDGKGTVRRETVSNSEIWCECYGKPQSDMKPSDSYAIAAIMVRIEGWERSEKRRRIPIYGTQRVYVRSESDSSDEAPDCVSDDDKPLLTD